MCIQREPTFPCHPFCDDIKTASDSQLSGHQVQGGFHGSPKRQCVIQEKHPHRQNCPRNAQHNENKCGCIHQAVAPVIPRSPRDLRAVVVSAIQDDQTSINPSMTSANFRPNSRRSAGTTRACRKGSARRVRPRAKPRPPTPKTRVKPLTSIQAQTPRLTSVPINSPRNLATGNSTRRCATRKAPPRS